MFKRKLLIGALAFGTVAGYSSGFMCLGAHAARCHASRRAAMETHIADVCTRSAHRVWEDEASEPRRAGVHPRDRHPRGDRFVGPTE